MNQKGKSGAPADILFVEDNPGDVRLAREAFGESNISALLHVVQDGVAAMAFLHGEGQYAKAPRPALILLDLNLPKKDGREVLAEIKADCHLRAIPVVVLTTSQSRADARNAYRLHANCYITKPFDLNDYIAVFRSVERFWLNVVRLPTNRNGSP